MSEVEPLELSTQLRKHVSKGRTFEAYLLVWFMHKSRSQTLTEMVLTKTDTLILTGTDLWKKFDSIPDPTKEDCNVGTQL